MDSIPIDTESGSQVVLELIYRLKLADVMTRDVLSASPGDSLRSIQILMRDRGITGVPILEGKRLVGIVSIGDIIEALDGGWIDDSAEGHMTRAVIVLEADMPLSFAISYLNRYGYRRFPVLSKEGELVGIITAADIIKALLVEMNSEVERLEEGLARKRKERLLAEGADPLNAGKAEPTIMSFPVRRFDFENAGKASAELKKALKRAELDSGLVRRAAVASYELELNQVIHSQGGVMEFRIDAEAIEIVARDTGPGIPDLEAALTEGFSTANQWIRSMGFGAGLGLPNAKRSSDEFSIESKLGSGTTVRAALTIRSKETQ